MAKMKRSLTSLSQMTQYLSGSPREILSVPVDDLISEAQVRKKFINLEELAESLKVEGQQSPIIVSPANVDGKYLIQKGERRWRAAKIAGLETVDILVNDKEQGSLDAIAGQLIENIQREALTPMEIAEGLGVLADGGMRGLDIAARIGKTSKYVSIHLALRDLSAPVKRLVDNDVVRDVELLYTLQQIARLDLQRCEAVCKQAETIGITRAEAKEIHQTLKKMRADANAAQKEKLAAQKTKTDLPESNADQESAAATSEKGARQAAVSEQQNPSSISSAKEAKNSNANKVKQVPPVNRFLTDEEREVLSDGAHDADDSNEHTERPAIIIKVQTNDPAQLGGELMLHRSASSGTKAWVRTDDGQEIEVELEALKITGISIKE